MNEVGLDIQSEAKFVRACDRGNGGNTGGGISVGGLSFSVGLAGFVRD